MRKIIFRGKWVDNGGWVYGDLWHDYNGKPRCIRDHCGSNPVDPATAGQYTGLKDKRGERIFEGDIVNGLFLFERQIAGVVTFRDGSFGVQWMRGRVEEFSAFTSCCNVAWEVIGNVVDNPELLEGGVNDG